jgi:hypothetical protein
MSASKRIIPGHREFIAFERYDGIFFRVLRKYAAIGKLQPSDVLIVSPTLGIVAGEQLLPDHNPYPGTWRHLRLDPETARKQHAVNIKFLETILSQHNYKEIYVNVGKNLMPLISGVDRVARCQVTFARGGGLGPKAQHMKNWILQGGREN